MSKNPVKQLDDLYHQWSAGEFDRREFVKRASALGLSAASLSVFFRAVPASAQGGTQSMTTAEYRAKLAEAYPFTADASGERSGGTVIMGEIASSNLTTVNMMLANNSPTLPVMNLVFETLPGTDPTNGQYVPLLADRWEIAEDGKTYTFHLVEAQWHDGTPFTADDVIFSFEAQADEATGSSYTASFNGAVASWSKIDDRTVQIVATDVFAEITFHGNAYCPIMPKHLWESVPHDQWATDPGSTGEDPSRVVGTGPFKFVELNTGEGTATFAPNMDYYIKEDVPRIDTWIFQVWPDETAAIEALRAGDIDFYENVPPADVEGLQAEDSLEVALYDTYSFSWYGYNLDPEKTPLFQDAKVRQALAFAVDRESMVQNIMLGYAEVAQGTQPILSIAYAPDRITTKYTFDTAKAAAMLDEAGWVLNGDVREKDGQKLSFEIMYGSGSATSDAIAASLQDFWKQVGVDARPNAVDFDTVLVPALVENFDYQMVLLGFNWDPTGDQSAMFSTDQYMQGFNAMKYSNPEVDRLFQEAARELDAEARREKLIEAADLVNEDLPILVLWFRKDRTGYNVRMQNFTPNGVQLLWSLPYVSVS